MNLTPPKRPLSDDPIEAFLLTLMAIGDIAIFTFIFPHFLTQPLAQSLDELCIACVLFLSQGIYVLVTHYDWPWLDD